MNKSSGQGEWLAGLAKRNTTPREPIPMAGYASRTDLSESVTSELCLKAMALQARDGTRAVLITADLLGFAADVSEAICGRIKEDAGLERSAILLNASHTHSGPLAFRRWAPGDESSPDVVQRYVKHLIDAGASAATEALGDMQPT